MAIKVKVIKQTEPKQEEAQLIGEYVRKLHELKQVAGELHEIYRKMGCEDHHFIGAVVLGLYCPATQDEGYMIIGHNVPVEGVMTGLADFKLDEESDNGIEIPFSPELLEAIKKVKGNQPS